MMLKNLLGSELIEGMLVVGCIWNPCFSLLEYKNGRFAGVMDGKVRKKERVEVKFVTFFLLKAAKPLEQRLTITYWQIVRTSDSASVTEV